MTITIHQYEERKIYHEALKKLCLVITEAFNHKKRVLIFLSGGSSVNLYTKLAGWITSKKNIGDDLAFAQVDERFHPGNQVVSRKYKVASKKNNSINAEAINESGLWRICDSQKIPCYLISQLGTLKESANKYNKIISKLFDSFDYKIAVLGIGEDGHIAGLLPGYQKKWDLPGFVAGYENNGKFKKRISLTPKTLIGLDYTLVTALGAKKRKPIERLLKKDKDIDFDKYPVAIVRDMRVVDLFTDLKH